MALHYAQPVAHAHDGLAPAGGATGQVLKKASGADYDYSWQADQTGAGGEAFPVGAVFIAVVSTNPGTLLGYGTWSAFAAGRVLVGLNAADPDFDTVEEVGGAKTVASAGTNTGAAVSAHTGTAVAAHADHTHTYTQVPNHVHRQQYNPTTTGSGSGPTTAPDTSSSGTTAWGTVDTQNPTGGVATATTNGASATLTHSVTQPADHTVTQPTFTGSATSVVQPFIVVYMWKRTA